MPQKKIQKKEYFGFILNREITDFTGPNMFNKIEKGIVYLIPKGRVYLRNDYFEYHLFLLKEAVEQRMNEMGFPIMKIMGDDSGKEPSLKIEKLGFTISYKEIGGYCLESQSQEPRLFNEISEIPQFFFRI